MISGIVAPVSLRSIAIGTARLVPSRGVRARGAPDAAVALSGACRNAAVLLTLRDSGVRFLAVDMPEANDLTVGIMALVAQAEREAISRWTKEALAVAKQRGV